MATAEVESIPVPVSVSAPKEEVFATADKGAKEVATEEPPPETNDAATLVSEPVAPERELKKDAAAEPAVEAVAQEVPTDKSADEQGVSVVAEPATVEETHEEAVAEEVPTEESADETAVPVMAEPAAVEVTHLEAVAKVVPTENPAEETTVLVVAEPAAVEDTQEEATIEPAAEAEPEAPAPAEKSAATVEAVREPVPAEKTEE